MTVNVTAKATDSSGNQLDVTSSAANTLQVEAVVSNKATPTRTSGKQGQPQKRMLRKCSTKVTTLRQSTTLQSGLSRSND